MKKLVLISLLPLAIISCSNVKKNLGMERSQPDEFAVTEGAPLTMPPNFNLMPPQPGAPRPQETKTSATAQNLVLGTGTSTTTTEVPAQDPTPQAAPSVPNVPIATSSLDKSADASLLSDASNAAAKPVVKPAKPDDGSVLRPTDESVRLQQENINTTVSPIMKPAQ
jgi:hypothetical protein